jgi:hypothetical protein
VNARDSFTVYLRDLAANDISFRVIDDGRHILEITRDISLYVRPDDDDLDAVIAGLRKLADAAEEMAGALGERLGDVAAVAECLDASEDQAEDTRRLGDIRALLAGFDWEHHDRQLALEAIERIVEGETDAD